MQLLTDTIKMITGALQTPRIFVEQIAVTGQR
jgi:hypothetical protein